MSRPPVHQSSPIAAADITISAGWGATATKGVVAGSSDLCGAVQVTAGGAGLAANPTITLTFKDGAFPVAPIPVLSRAGTGQPTLQFNWTSGTTALVMTLIGTPAGGEIFIVSWIIGGGA